MANYLDDRFSSVESVNVGTGTNGYYRLDVSTTSASLSVAKGVYTAYLSGVDVLQVSNAAVTTPSSGALSATAQRCVASGDTVRIDSDITLHAAAFSGSGILVLQSRVGA